jgi:aspartate carbamoyltransferase catalytic subunit
MLLLSLRYETLKLRYVVTPATLEDAKPSLVLMHPLPRVGEIDTACDSDPRAAYFRQVSLLALKAQSPS